ncbi:MAG: Rid family hydrolase [Thermoguttaceae bacterium]|nr:Rid family hydrolase [Thermoguttaceae bacterium]MDW8038270.1 Rid family hydrolase [Thermoguttaceae bacterium]
MKWASQTCQRRKGFSRGSITTFFTWHMPLALTIVLPAFLWANEAQTPKVCYLSSEAGTGTSSVVVVEGAGLVYTAQIFPLDAQGQLIGPESVETQIAQVLANLQKALRLVGSNLEDLIRLEIHVTAASATEKVQKILAKQFTGQTKPAVNWVLTPLPVKGALVAADALAVARPEKLAAETTSGAVVVRQRSAELPGLTGAAHAAVLPAGGVVYLSGQPEKGQPVPAAKKAMETLLAMLGQMGLSPEHVVHVKVFLGPMEHAEAVQKELVAMWSKKLAPPISIVQWKSSAPVEIELVAADPAKPGETVERPVHYYNPPGVEPSPRFSRAARVRSNKLIFIGTLASPQPGPGDQQVEAIFARLEELLHQNGSDLRHLVKATYYCADASSSKALDAIRLQKFDPKRPPAASKAMVSGVAIPDRTVVIDMIAAPKQ